MELELFFETIPKKLPLFWIISKGMKSVKNAIIHEDIIIVNNKTSLFSLSKNLDFSIIVNGKLEKIGKVKSYFHFFEIYYIFKNIEILKHYNAIPKII